MPVVISIQVSDTSFIEQEIPDYLVQQGLTKSNLIGFTIATNTTAVSAQWIKLLETANCMIYEVDDIISWTPLGDLDWPLLPDVLKTANRTVRIGWHRIVRIYDRGTGRHPSKSTSRATVQYMSHDDTCFQDWLDLHVGPSHLAVTINDELVMETFFDNFHKEIDIFLVPSRSPYGSLHQTVLLSKVSVVERFTGTKRSHAAAAVGPEQAVDISDCALLDRMRSVGGGLLDSAMNNARKSIQEANKEADWQSICDLVHRKLTMLNNSCQANDAHNESARRMVINEFITAVAFFSGMEWSIDESIFSKSRRGAIGWGPLDYCFDESTGNTFLVYAAVAPPPDEDEDEPQQRDYTPLLNGTISALHNAIAVKGMGSQKLDDLFKGIEAKKVFNDHGLTQLGCQMYDCLMEQAKAQTADDIAVYGCLCTGHRWLYVGLLWPANQRDQKPVFKYLGEVQVAVLRLDHRDRRHRMGTSERESGCYYDQMDVSKEEVERVMLSLYAGIAVGFELTV